jgi:hypothetical protein
MVGRTWTIRAAMLLVKTKANKNALSRTMMTQTQRIDVRKSERRGVRRSLDLPTLPIHEKIKALGMAGATLTEVVASGSRTY